jgi:hypothetical protein
MAAMLCPCPCASASASTSPAPAPAHHLPSTRSALLALPEYKEMRILLLLSPVPCRTYNFQDVLVASPSATCVVAHPSYTYASYTGDDSYLQVRIISGQSHMASG